ncbi:MAG: flagellar motor switch protein FliM [Syntrophaceticus sp.]|nr:flagellar motor switch protein FliM [Syntrophaceticus sp.]
MGEILSQDEIDSLLAALTSGEVTTEELGEEEKSVKNYDFRHPNKFSKEQINFLELIYDNYARAIATFLSAKLRISVQISVMSIEQVTYGEFTNSISDPSIMVIYDMNPLHGDGIMEIQPPLVFCMLDRLLGGCGGGAVDDRTLTEIESTIIKQLTQQMLDISREAWENVIDMKPRVELIESNPQFAQIVSPSEMVILISLAVKFADTEGTLNICLPFIVLEPVLDKMSVHNWFAKGSKGDDPRQRQLLEQQIESMAVPVTVILGRTSIAVRELLDLQVGDVVLFDRKTDEDIDVYIDACRKFTAKPGRRNSYLAAQITDFVGKGGTSIG